MSHERLAVSAADLDDLDMPALDAFLRERAPALYAVGPREDVATRMGLLAKVAPRVVPTLVGLYAFGKLPQLFFPEWGLSAVALQGATLTDPIRSRVDLDGNVRTLIEGALEFLREHTGGELGAGEGSEYPEDVVREVLVNAVVHRDLRKPSRVALRLFVDRLEVWSPGGPPEGLGDLDELAREGGVSQPRNPILASIARHLGLGEQLGRGLALVAHHGATHERVELRGSVRDLCVVLPSRWRRPAATDRLS